MIIDIYIVLFFHYLSLADPHSGNILFCPSIPVTQSIPLERGTTVVGSNQDMSNKTPSKTSSESLLSPLEKTIDGTISPGLLDFGMTIR